MSINVFDQNFQFFDKMFSFDRAGHLFMGHARFLDMVWWPHMSSTRWRCHILCATLIFWSGPICFNGGSLLFWWPISGQLFAWAKNEYDHQVTGSLFYVWDKFHWDRRMVKGSNRAWSEYTRKFSSDYNSVLKGDGTHAPLRLTSGHPGHLAYQVSWS